MFTQCTECRTWFQVSADQLKVADGQVRCGCCRAVFNALANLTDTSLTPGAATQPDGEGLSKPKGKTVVSPDLTDPERMPIVPLQPAVSTHLSGLKWVLGTLVVALLLIGQHAYLNRDNLAQQPQLRPWMERLCVLVGCELLPFRDVGSIELVNRDVRMHPHQGDVLLIHATLVNHASLTQPFPVVEIMLTDIDGTIVAKQDFTPLEYLGKVADPCHGMPPEVPVHFSLQTPKPPNDAVNFAFAFR